MRADKILLVYPPNGKDSKMTGSMMEPLPLEYIAAAFQGREVQIIDLRLEPGLIQRLSTFKPDIVGFTAFSINVNTIINLAKQVKKILPFSKTIVGGYHATASPQEFNIPEIDFIVIGEGCSVIHEMLNCGGNFQSVKGLIYREGNKSIFTAHREYPSLDSLPLPRRDLVSKYSKYYYYAGICPVVSIRTSTGCPYRCTFCSSWGITDGRYLKRDINSIVKELSDISTKDVFFADEESMLEYERMMELADAIQKAKIKKKYILFARADTIIKYPDLFEKWKKIGLNRVLVGYESFSNENLVRYNKSLTLIKQNQAKEVLNKIGVVVQALFIINPDYSEEDFLKMRRYVKQMGFRYSSFAVLTPFPGSVLYEKMEMDKTVKNWDYFDTEHAVLPTKLEIKHFYALYHNLCKDFWPLPERIFMNIQSIRLKSLYYLGV